MRRYALERRLHELPDALPGMSYFCLSTFFGIDDARRVERCGGPLELTTPSRRKGSAAPRSTVLWR